MRHNEKHYEEDPISFPEDARYSVRQYRGVAFYVLGWETEPVAVCLCPDCDFMSIEREGGGGKVVEHGNKECEHAGAYYSDEPEYERTGRVLAVMVGDDYKHSVDRADIEEIDPLSYCAECGQIGCCHDGRERD